MSAANNEKTNNFWQGFAFGIASAAGLAYLIGTKTGREKLKNVLDYMENYQGNADSLFDAIDGLLADSKKTDAALEKAAEAKTDLTALIDKVKSITKS